MSKQSEAQKAQMSLSLSSRSRGDDRPETPAPAVIAPRVKPVRITIDMEPDQHRRLKVWAVEADDAKLAEVVRVLVDQLTGPDADPRFVETVRKELHRRASQ